MHCHLPGSLWPGNAKEKKNLIRQSVQLCDRRTRTFKKCFNFFLKTGVTFY